MDPARKRTIRLVIALSVAVLLAGALVYTSFSAATEAKQPSQLISGASPGKSYELTGTVAREASATTAMRCCSACATGTEPPRYPCATSARSRIPSGKAAR